MRKLIAITAVAVGLIAAAPASAAIQDYANSTPIDIPGSGLGGVANPYGTGVTVSGKTAPVVDVNVTLHGVDHERPREIRLALVAPNGDAVSLMNANCGTDPIVNYSFVFDQLALNPMPSGSACPGVAYRPNPVFTANPMPSPAPSTTYGMNLDVLNGANPNGTWTLYAEDTGSGGIGQIRRGWSLTLTTADTTPAMKIPAAGTFYVANPYPATLDVSGREGVVTDVNVSLEGVYHQRPDDLDLLLVGPRGQSVVLMSDACGTFDPEGDDWTWDDEAFIGPMFDGFVKCSSGAYKPTDFEPGEVWPAPAPAGPHGSELSVFDLTDPNGQWRLYATDDATGASGFVMYPFGLEITTRPKARVAFTEGAVRFAEGETRELTLRRSGDDLKRGEVTVTTVPQSAAALEDFSPVSTTVEFAPGQAEQRVRVDALADGAAEGEETYGVSLSDFRGDAAPSGQATVIITAQELDAPARCAGQSATITGTSGRDVLKGTPRRDVIAALGGRDSIKAARGNDIVCAGGGPDRVLGGAGNDRVSGGRGRDVCPDGPGRDQIKCERRS